jgi:small subunit ribosomal protein S4
MPKRKRKAFNRPRKLFDSTRIKEENNLIKKYGLKNKREVWRADFAIEKIRNIAKKLITASPEEKQKFIDKQKSRGFEIETIAGVLGLGKEDYLKRRLQSVVTKKKLSQTPRQARQFIAHKHVTIAGNIIDSPSHLTTLKEEADLDLIVRLPIKKKEAIKEEVKTEEKPEAGEKPVVENEVKEESK